MELVAVVIALALLEFAVFGMLVGRARGLYGVKAPATSGHEIFDRYFRVHYNTMEQLVVFVPSIWIFGLYLSPTWAAGLGAVFVIGRIVYIRGYVADPARREIGFALSAVPVLVLSIGALVGALVGALRAAL
jgi:glutathione S-transferase